jgi:very-long-chain enoyl-CoA reductase
VRKIPTGFGFGAVTCPNYSFEILAWIAVTGLTRSWAAFLLTAIGAVQMGLWAQKKRKRYIAEFGNEWKPRALLVPGVL